MSRSRPLRSGLREAAVAHRASCHRSFHTRAPLAVRISSTPTAPPPGFDGGLPLPTSTLDSGPDSPDARFEVLGAPSSLLSVSLSASQNLYTRRGTLVAVTGQAENAVSTLSVLEPFRRALLRIPFLYQRISSTSPITALIATKSPLTSFAVVHLDGTVDWMVAQRQALLAWTGHTMSVRPTIDRKLSLAHWGNSEVFGRGLLALAGQGQVYQVTLQQGEEFVAHPSNVVAYTITQHPPLPYRLRSSTLRLQIPDFAPSAWIPDTKFFRVMRESATWKFLVSLSFTFRTWSRRTIWGDRLFLQFRGPTTILLQSRAARLNDVLTTREVNEIADTAPGVVSPAVTLERNRNLAEQDKEGPAKKPKADVPTSISVASVGPDGKVAFKDADDLKEIGGR